MGATVDKLWVNNPALYWSEFDRAMDDFERLGLYSTPSIGTLARGCKTPSPPHRDHLEWLHPPSSARAGHISTKS